MGKLIYKYYRVNEYLFDVLISNQLYFSSIAQFNDPYDCHFVLKNKPTAEEYGHFWEQQSVSEEDYKYLLELFEKSPEKAIEPLLEGIRKQLEYFGICCFAETKDELLMWSHYADSHFGVCLGFDYEEMTGKFLQYDNVKYSSTPHLFDITDVSNSLSKAILTKSIQWEYENEIRFLMERSKSSDFYMSSLREINFGHRCSTRHMVNIIYLVQKLGYARCSFNRANINESDYSLTFSSINFDELKEGALKESEEIRFLMTLDLPKKDDN